MSEEFDRDSDQEAPPELAHVEWDYVFGDLNEALSAIVLRELDGLSLGEDMASTIEVGSISYYEEELPEYIIPVDPGTNSVREVAQTLNVYLHELLMDNYSVDPEVAERTLLDLFIFDLATIFGMLHPDDDLRNTQYQWTKSSSAQLMGPKKKCIKKVRKC